MAKIERVEVLMVDLKPKVKRVDAMQSFVSQETPIVRIFLRGRRYRHRLHLHHRHWRPRPPDPGASHNADRDCTKALISSCVDMHHLSTGDRKRIGIGQ